MVNPRSKFVDQFCFNEVFKKQLMLNIQKINKFDYSEDFII